jgi:hypothetical protein
VLAYKRAKQARDPGPRIRNKGRSNQSQILLARRRRDEGIKILGLGEKGRFIP